MKPKILLVEDDANLVELLRYNLESAGFDVVQTGDGEEALMLADEEKPDLVILDWMIANLSGIEVCRRLRRAPETASLPIVMLTARADEADRIRGLETGADDYLTKPFSPRELIARIHAVLRRLRPALAGGALDYAGISMDTSAHRVTRDGQAVPLGPTEFRLLDALARAGGDVVPHIRLARAGCAACANARHGRRHGALARMRPCA